MKKDLRSGAAFRVGVWGVGFRVSGVGVRVQGLGFRVEGLCFRAFSGLEVRGWGWDLGIGGASITELKPPWRQPRGKS